MAPYSDPRHRPLGCLLHAARLLRGEEPRRGLPCRSSGASSTSPSSSRRSSRSSLPSGTCAFPRIGAKVVAEMERRRWLRPLVVLGRRFAPQARFFWRAADAGQPRPRADRAAGGARGRWLRLRRLRDPVQRQPRTDRRRRSRRSTSSTTSARRLADRCRQGCHALGSGVAVTTVTVVAAIGFGVRRH